MRRLLSLLLVLATVLSAVSMTVLAANPFTDVPQSEWFYNDVINAYEMGLINGKSATLYKPNDNLTYAEAVKLAACMNQRYTTGSVNLQNGTPWYQTYVDYCKTKKIIDVDYAWEQPATRAGYMEIFAGALPDSALKKINNVPDGSIPDVPMSHNQAGSIYKLYRAGILQGNDAAHNCNPGASIKRSEVAAILTRMMDSSKRIQFSMDANALRIEQNPTDVTCSNGETITFSVKAAGGTEPYTYKWEYIHKSAANWKAISNSNKQTLGIVVSESDLAAECQFRCVVTDATGKSVTSTAAKLIAKVGELKISTQPQNTSAAEGSKAELSIAVEGGNAPYTFKWMASDGSLSGIAGIDITSNKDTGSSNISILVEDVTAAWISSSNFYCIVTDSAGKSVTSNAVKITVQNGLKIKTQPVGGNKTVGETIILSVVAEGGTAPYSYQWYVYEGKMFKSFMPLSNSGNAENVTTDTMRYTFTDADGAKKEFRCTVTDSKGNTVNSDTAVVNIAAAVNPLTITTHPKNTTAVVGNLGVLSVVVEGGTAPYSYQWQMNVALPGKKPNWSNLSDRPGVSGTQTAQLALVADAPKAADFRCVITDANGDSVISSPAVFAVTTP